ncbi:MAG: GIY-YIG nuclease family protein [Candidatus Aureabacteria bacterium]|nr:GIY-YIG nuclease family protein [Candidatus Auribacterota bacterium]
MKNSVYVLHSKKGDYFYVGRATDINGRLNEHNNGKCKHTSEFRPWEIVASITLKDEKKALEFEKYLKTGSGLAFQKRHF